MNDQPMCLIHQEPIYGYCQKCHDTEVGQAAIAAFARGLTEDRGVKEKLGMNPISNGVVCESICALEDCLGDACPIRKAANLGGDNG